MPRTIDRSVPIKASLIHPNPWNPYANKSDRLQDAIAESIGEFSQIQDVVVRPHPEKKGSYQILDGEGRHRTFHGDAEIFCTVIHGLTDAQAKKITIVMDETRATADKIELASLLAELNTDYGDDLILGLPYSEKELEELIKLDDIDWNSYGDADDEAPVPPAKATEQADEAPQSAVDADGSIVVPFKISASLLGSIDQIQQALSGKIDYSEDFGANLAMTLDWLIAEKLQEGMEGF
jgi:ParB-like chromosome segregation protein Spo0J